MRTLLAGSFDPAGSARELPAPRGHDATVLRRGALQVAFTGPPAHEQDGLLILATGVLDNRRGLAAELRQTPGADTATVLAAAYRRWGTGLLPRLSGDFALVIWDRENAEGLLARDRLGVHGMYIREQSGELYFASEITDLLACLPARPPPDRLSVAHWVAVSARPGTSTLYEGVRRLEPGGMIALGRRGHRTGRYWTPTYTEPGLGSTAEHAGALRGALRRAVAGRLPDSGRAGVLMSGGLDSASVAAVAARVRGHGDVSAYAGVFPEHPALDESGLIETMRRHAGLRGLDAHVRPGGLLGSVVEHVTAWQLPLLGWGDFWTVPLLRAATTEGVTVTLGGDGGDELFAARSYLMADLLRARRPRASARLLRRLPGAGVRPPRRQAAGLWWRYALAGAAPYTLHAALSRAHGAFRGPPWLTAAAARDLARSDDPHAWKRLDGPRWWAQPAHALTRGVEEAGIFEHQRQRAATVGVRARHPLLDPDLIVLALAQPPELSFDPVLSRPMLRESMSGLMPDAVRLRPGKAWFDQLIVDCLTGPDRPVIRALLGGGGGEVRAFADTARAVRALDGLGSATGVARFAAMHMLWRLITIECWLRLQADPSGSSLPDPGTLTRPDVRFRPFA